MAMPPKNIANGIIFAHWSRLLEGFEPPPVDFYAQVEEAIKKREVPEAKLSRVEWKEGGLLSARREYLRVERGRYIFDCCAARFGTGYFYSSWLTVLPRELTLFHFLGMGTTCFILLFLFTKIFGLILGIFLLIAGLFALSRMMRANLFTTQIQFEEYLTGLTILGAIYDVYIRKLTYYEADTADMFQKAVHAAMLEVVDEAGQAKGLRALSEEERKPVMTEFFKR